MNGRWQISNPERRNAFISGPHTRPGLTPVVPCDDAAVERATRVLTTLVAVEGWADLEKDKERVVQIILAAAGEMP